MCDRGIRPIGPGKGLSIKHTGTRLVQVQEPHVKSRLDAPAGSLKVFAGFQRTKRPVGKCERKKS
jgi:hypothetical protein